MAGAICEGRTKDLGEAAAAAMEACLGPAERAATRTDRNRAARSIVMIGVTRIRWENFVVGMMMVS
jgi:hypothetical protein